ncbi:MAG: hypothetical protein AAF705_07605, partial [Bacteroidota bacterium]
SAQSNKETQPITKVAFKMVYEVQKNNSLKVIIFQPIKGNKKVSKVKIIDSKSIPGYELKPGTKVTGTFNFSTFASDGGLGGTRIYRGKGTGIIMIGEFRSPNQKTIRPKRRLQQKMELILN